MRCGNQDGLLTAWKKRYTGRTFHLPAPCPPGAGDAYGLFVPSITALHASAPLVNDRAHPMPSGRPGT